MKLTEKHIVLQIKFEVGTISALSWLGLSSGTNWNDLEDSKAELTAGLVAELCAHFLNVAPKLLTGIHPN
jgi:hypothetical protein